jgi:hypothetical protein
MVFTMLLDFRNLLFIVPCTKVVTKCQGYFCDGTRQNFYLRRTHAGTFFHGIGKTNTTLLQLNFGSLFALQNLFQKRNRTVSFIEVCFVNIVQYLSCQGTEFLYWFISFFLLCLLNLMKLFQGM